MTAGRRFSWMPRRRRGRTGGTARTGGAGGGERPAVKAYEPPGSDDGLLRSVDAGERCRAMDSAPGALRRFLVFGTRPGPLPSFTGLVEPPEPLKIGVCCSGGGIRSAAFNLGALQQLQEANELQRAAYLAAVSGGSYIAAAFSMVAKTWPAESVGRPGAGAAGHDDSDPSLFGRCKPFAPGSPEEQYLRNRSSYMAPDLNAKVFLAYRIVIGLVFNLIFLSLPVIALGLVLGELLYRPSLTCKAADFHRCAHHVLWWWWAVPGIVVGLSVFLASWEMLRRSGSRRRQFLETWAVRLLALGFVLAFVLVAVPLVVESLTGAPGSTATGYGAVGSGGLVGLVAGVVGLLRQAFATPKKALEELTATQRRLRGLSAKTRLAVAYFAGAVIGPLLFAGVFIVAIDVALENSPGGVVNDWVLGAAGGAGLLFVGLYRLADLTSWSLHPYYKRRLSTAFALKRIRSTDLTPAERERFEAKPPVLPPDPDHTGIAIERDFDLAVKLSETAVKGAWPTLLVCAAANVCDTGATPPGRHVTSFTFSSHTIGGPLVGAASMAEYEERLEQTGRRAHAARRATSDGGSGKSRTKSRRHPGHDFSLPAAVAMSGAAISPSMGKITRRSFTFLLALANVRLGVWVPNPRYVMGKTGRLKLGRPRPGYLVNELLGVNRIGGKYLYVTDGGHYENLGLVELLRRGCTKIYCFDASGGEGFEALGDAVALARSELGVHLPIDPSRLFPDKLTDFASTSTVRVDFDYPPEPGGGKPQGERATLVYARNVLTAHAPWDARAYHKIDPNFPHNSTSDQLYTDQKFEAYRILGELAARRAVEAMHEA